MLAGLGRVGDASCVPPVLRSIREAKPPTLLVGLNALAALPGSEVTRSLVEAYPQQPPTVRSGLLTVLGSRRDPLVLPILAKAVRSEQAADRLAAIDALADTRLPAALELLNEAASHGDEALRARARDAHQTLASRLSAEKQGGESAEHELGTKLHAMRGIVGKWYVVGPFELGEKNEGWETNFVDEPKANVVARYMSGKTRRQWKLVTSSDPTGKIDLRAALGNRDHCVGYALAEIERRPGGRRGALAGGRRQRENLGQRREGVRAIRRPWTPGRPGSSPCALEARRQHHPAEDPPEHPGLGVLRPDHHSPGPSAPVPPKGRVTFAWHSTILLYMR